MVSKMAVNGMCMASKKTNYDSLMVFKKAIKGRFMVFKFMVFMIFVVTFVSKHYKADSRYEPSQKP